LLQRARRVIFMFHVHVYVSTFSMNRAVDNQVYFSMCSPARDLTAGYHAVSFSDGVLRIFRSSTFCTPVGPFIGRRSDVSPPTLGRE